MGFKTFFLKLVVKYSARSMPFVNMHCYLNFDVLIYLHTYNMNYFEFLVAFVSFVWSGFAQVTCNEPGQCINSTIITITHPLSAIECLTDCKAQPGCNFYTFNPELDNLCELFDDCGNLTIAGCTECVSGHVNCSDVQCGLIGLCQVPRSKHLTYKSCT